MLFFETLIKIISLVFVLPRLFSELVFILLYNLLFLCYVNTCTYSVFIFLTGLACVSHPRLVRHSSRIMAEGFLYTKGHVLARLSGPIRCGDLSSFRAQSSGKACGRVVRPQPGFLSLQHRCFRKSGT